MSDNETAGPSAVTGPPTVTDPSRGDETRRAQSLQAQTERWRRFRQHRDTALAEEHGWLTLTSLQWLPAEPGRLDLVPGLWSADGTTANLTATADDGLLLAAEGTPVDGTITATLADEESLDWVRHGTILVELAVRGGRPAIRTRDSTSPVLTSFTGVPVFDYDPAWVIEGSWKPYPEPRDVPIGTANPHVGGVHRSAGEVVFELDGREHRLQAESGGLGELTVTFHDASNGASTAEWRKLSITRPRPDGTVTVDFNRAVNYPSAFTPYGTCPRPVDGNSLDVEVNAGERRP